MKSVRSSAETTTPAPTPGRPLLLALTAAACAPRTAVPPKTAALASSLATLPPRHAPDLHKLCPESAIHLAAGCQHQGHVHNKALPDHQLLASQAPQ